MTYDIVFTISDALVGVHVNVPIRSVSPTTVKSASSGMFNIDSVMVLSASASESVTMVVNSSSILTLYVFMILLSITGIEFSINKAW